MIHSPKLTCPLKRSILKGDFILQPSIFKGLCKTLVVSCMSQNLLFGETKIRFPQLHHEHDCLTCFPHVRGGPHLSPLPFYVPNPPVGLWQHYRYWLKQGSSFHRALRATGGEDGCRFGPQDSGVSGEWVWGCHVLLAHPSSYKWRDMRPL